MPGWVLWLIAAGAFGVGEGLTTTFFLAPFGFGALLGAVADLAGAPGLVSWIVFVVGSLLTLVLLRPLVMRNLHSSPALRTGSAALIGQPAVVLERIANDEGAGCIKVNGEVWTARSLDEDKVIERGTRVEVVDIKGATALVIE